MLALRSAAKAATGPAAAADDAMHLTFKCTFCRDSVSGSLERGARTRRQSRRARSDRCAAAKCLVERVINQGCGKAAMM